MYKFGAITIDVSHPKRFSETLLQDDRARYTAVFNDGFRGDDEVEAFAEINNLTICSTLDELADQVDLAFLHACNWDKHLQYLQPFIERGKPVFVDKPLVGNLADARKLLDLSKAGAKIIGTSALRYADDVLAAKSTISEKGSKIMHVDVSVGVDDFNYAIHALEEICTLIDSKPVSVKFVGNAKSGEEVCDTYFISFEGGETACYHNFLKRQCQFHTIILTDKGGDTAFTVDGLNFYNCLMNQVCNYIEGKENILASVEDMLVPITLALACKASKLSNGEAISLDDPRLEDVSFDGYEFERAYAAKAAKLFVK